MKQALVLVVLLTCCSSASDDGTGSDAALVASDGVEVTLDVVAEALGETSCGPCEQLTAGGCMPMGLATCPEGWAKTESCGCAPLVADCGAGERPVFGGTCAPVGPECPLGWEEEEGGGCTVGVPECPTGQVPLLGLGCTALGPTDECGTGPWGPSEGLGTGTIVHVLEGASPEGADGSVLAPFATLAEALAVVEALQDAGGEATVLLGAPDEGATYQGGVVVGSVAIVGRCSALVTIEGAVGVEGYPLPVDVVVDFRGATGARLERVTLGGSAGGVAVSISSDVAITDVVVEEAVGVGVLSFLSQTVQVTRVGVAPVAPSPDFGYGIGLFAHSSEDVVVEDASFLGGVGEVVGAIESSVAIERAYVGGCLESADGWGGGVVAEDGVDLSLRSSLVEGNRGAGVYGAGASVLIEDTIIQGSLPLSDDLYGYAVGLQGGEGSISGCLLRDNYVAGASGVGSTLEITGTRIEGTMSMGLDQGGMGVLGYDGGSVTLVDCTVVGNVVAGAYFVATTASITRTILTSSLPDASGDLGWGVFVQGAESFSLIDSLVTHNFQAGVVAMETSATIRGSVVSATEYSEGASLELAWGLSLEEVEGATVEETFVTGSMDTAVSIWRSDVVFTRCLVTETAPTPSGEWGGGVDVSDGSCVTFDEVAVIDAKGAGISVVNSLGTITGCYIASIGETNGTYEEEGLDPLPLEGLADGIISASFTAEATMDITRTTIEGCARAGLLYQDAAGTLHGNVIASSTYGMALQSSTVDDADTTFVDNDAETPAGQLFVDNSSKELPEL